MKYPLKVTKSVRQKRIMKFRKHAVIRNQTHYISNPLSTVITTKRLRQYVSRENWAVRMGDVDGIRTDLILGEFVVCPVSSWFCARHRQELVAKVRNMSRMDA